MNEREYYNRIHSLSHKIGADDGKSWTEIGADGGDCGGDLNCGYAKRKVAICLASSRDDEHVSSDVVRHSIIKRCERCEAANQWCKETSHSRIMSMYDIIKQMRRHESGNRSFIHSANGTNEVKRMSSPHDSQTMYGIQLPRRRGTINGRELAWTAASAKRSYKHTQTTNTLAFYAVWWNRMSPCRADFFCFVRSCRVLFISVFVFTCGNESTAIFRVFSVCVPAWKQRWWHRTENRSMESWNGIDVDLVRVLAHTIEKANAECVAVAAAVLSLILHASQFFLFFFFVALLMQQ